MNGQNKIKMLYSGYTVANSMSKLVAKMASIISDKMVFITILKGGVFLTSHLLQRFVLPQETYLGYIGIRSYREGEIVSGTPISYSELLLSEEHLKDATVIIVDDVIETGETLRLVRNHILNNYKPRDVYTCVLVNKQKDGVVREFGPDFYGLDYMGSKFLVGCGMDLEEKYRNLDYVGYIL